MAFLPKNTSYNVFAGLNLVSVAAVLVLSIMTAGDVLMSGDTASALGPVVSPRFAGRRSLCCSSALSVFITGLFSHALCKGRYRGEAPCPPSAPSSTSRCLACSCSRCCSPACPTTSSSPGRRSRPPRLSTVFLVGIYKNKTGARGVLEVRDGLHRRRGLRPVRHAAHLRERRRYHAQRA